MSHSVFSAHIIDQTAYKSSDWMIDTRVNNHMVHSVSLLTITTSILHSFVYLPNREKDLVTHRGTVQISETLTLNGVLCVPYFSFDLKSITQITRVTLCCLIFLGSSCFV